MVEQATGTREEFFNPDTGETEAIIRPPVSMADIAAELREKERSHILTIEEIEQAEDILEATVYIPEWHGSVRVRQFSKETEFRLRKAAIVGGEIDKSRLEMLIVITGLIEPVVTEEYLGMLEGKSMRAIDTILSKITALNAISKEAAEEATRQFLEGR